MTGVQTCALPIFKVDDGHRGVGRQQVPNKVRPNEATTARNQKRGHGAPHKPNTKKRNRTTVGLRREPEVVKPHPKPSPRLKSLRLQPGCGMATDFVTLL